MASWDDVYDTVERARDETEAILPFELTAFKHLKGANTLSGLLKIVKSVLAKAEDMTHFFEEQPASLSELIDQLTEEEEVMEQLIDLETQLEDRFVLSDVEPPDEVVDVAGHAKQQGELVPPEPQAPRERLGVLLQIHLAQPVIVADELGSFAVLEAHLSLTELGEVSVPPPALARPPRPKLFVAHRLELHAKLVVHAPVLD